MDHLDCFVRGDTPARLSSQFLTKQRLTRALYPVRLRSMRAAALAAASMAMAGAEVTATGQAIEVLLVDPGGAWSDKKSWDPERVPDNGAETYFAEIFDNVTLDISPTVDGINWTTGIISGPGQLTLEAQSTIGGGTFAAPLGIINNGTITQQGQFTTLQGSLTNRGTGNRSTGTFRLENGVFNQQRGPVQPQRVGRDRFRGHQQHQRVL